MHFSLYKGWNYPFLLGDIIKTVARYDIETLFIIIERYVKLYIFDCVEILHDRAMAICVIALNRDVSGKSHCIKIISHSFSILSSVESASIPCTGSIGCYQQRLVFFAKIAIVTHLRINLRTCVVPKNLLGPFLRL